MNAFWRRADAAGVLQPLLEVVKKELRDEKERKEERLKTLDSLTNIDEIKKREANDGMTRDEARRILSNVTEDLGTCCSEMANAAAKDAVDGESSFACLYASGGDPSLWQPKMHKGQKPVDVLVVREQEAKVLLGDCKFGMKSEESSMVRDKRSYDESFGSKIRSVASFLNEQDGVAASEEVLFIVTSDLAPVLRHRMDDYALGESSRGIPYEHIHVCSVVDLRSVVSKISLD